MRDRQKKLFSLLVLKCSCSSVLSMMVPPFGSVKYSRRKKSVDANPSVVSTGAPLQFWTWTVIGMGVGAGNGLKVTLAGTVPNLMVALTGGLH